MRHAADKHRRLAAALREPGALPAIVYAGTRNASEELAARAGARRSARRSSAYHAGLDRGARAADPGAVHVRRGPGDRRHQRLRHGDRQGRRAHGLPRLGAGTRSRPTTRRPAAPGRDGRPARCLLFAEQRDKGLHVFFIERARVEDAAFERVAERLRWAGARRPLRRRLARARRAAGPRRTTSRARDHRPPRARRHDRARALAPDRAAGRLLAAWDGRRWRSAAARRARPSGPAGASTGRLGVRRGRSAGAARCCALRRPLGSSAPADACCDVCDPAVPRRRPRRARSAGRERRPRRAVPGARRGDPRGRRPARPPVGRTRAVEILRGGRSKVIAEHSYDGLPAYGTFAHLRSGDVLGRVDELLDAGTLRSTGGRFPKLARRMKVAVLASGAGTNLQALLDRVHGRDGVEIVAVASDRPAARRSSARAPPASEARRSRSPRYADRAARDQAMADWLRDARRRAGRAGRLHAAAARGAFLGRFPGRVINVHPALLPAFPGLHAVEQALDYGVKVFGVTVHFVDEGVDTGPVILQRAIELPGRARRRRGARAPAPDRARAAARGGAPDRARRGAARPRQPTARARRAVESGRDGRQGVRARRRCADRAGRGPRRARAAVGVRQDRDRRVRPRSRRARHRDRLHRRHRPGARRTPASRCARSPTSPAFPRSWTAASRRFTRSSTPGCSRSATTRRTCAPPRSTTSSSSTSCA